MNAVSNRRDFLRNVSGAAIGAAALPLVAGCARKGPRAQDVILVTLDTLGSRHLGCYGYTRDTSPRLDAFAQDAVLFKRTYANTHCTLPGHATLLTGRYPHNNGVVLQQPLNKNAETLGTVLKARGYRTAAVAATHLLTHATIGQGFDSFDSIEDRRAQVNVDLALDWLRKHDRDDSPLFLWLHLKDPHTVYAPPEPFDGKFLDVAGKRLLEDLKPLSTNNLRKNSVRQARPCSEAEQEVVIAQYDAEVAYMDHHVGRFLDSLKQRRRFDSAIIAVTADHGECLFENNDYWLGHATVHEPVVQIPMILSHPDYKAARVDGLVQQIDLLPTICEWLGAAGPTVDGLSLSGIAASGASIRNIAFFSENGDSIFGATDGRYKLRQHSKHRFNLPIPEEWQRQIDTLPKMRFLISSEHPRYEETSGAIEDVCIAPESCADQVESFEFQYLIGDSLKAMVAGLPTQKDGNLGRHLVMRHSKRLWNRFACAPHNSFRMIARDKNGQVIASTRVVHRRPDTPLGDSEVYDLKSDPDERVNLAHRETSVPQILTEALSAYAAASVEALEKADSGRVGIGDELQEQLRDLGYIE